MATNEVTSMFKSVDIVQKLQDLRLGCDMGDRGYIMRDEAANLLMEENDVMIRLFQGINKAVQDKERDERDLAEGNKTVEQVKDMYRSSRYGPRSQGTATGLVRTLGLRDRDWKCFYHELVVDDKLLKPDLEQFMRSLQYIGDQGWSRLLDKLVEFQNQKVESRNQLESDLMQVIKVFFLITQHVPPMRRAWERKDEIVPILVQKCMGQSYDVLKQTALVIIIHLMLVTKDSEEIDWLAVDCDFARKLLNFLESTSYLKEVAPVLNHVMMAFIALLELGGPKTRQRVKSFGIDGVFRRLVRDAAKHKGLSPDEKLMKTLTETYLKLADDPNSVKYFTKYPRENRIAFRWEFRRVPVFCSNTDCARPQEHKERFRHCSRCMITYYCSPGCQKEHWKTAKSGPKHKEVCVPIPESKPKTSPPEGTTSPGAASSPPEGATGSDVGITLSQGSDRSVMMLYGTNYIETKDGGLREPTAEDIRQEVEEKVRQLGLTVDSVKKYDMRKLRKEKKK